MTTNQNTERCGGKKKNDLAIFPCFPPYLEGEQFGYSVGWMNGEYCFVWGNYKTRQQAEAVLKKEYPEHKIIYFDKENQPYHRWNKPNNDKKRSDSPMPSQPR